MPQQAPDGFVNARLMQEDIFHPGFLCYGVPVGSDDYVLKMVDRKMDELEKETEMIGSVL